MTGISDLQKVFANTSQRAEAIDEVTSARSSRVQAGSTATSGIAGLDRSSVSSAGGALVEAVNQSDVRTDKVAALQSAIANGTYNVSSAQVAESLINSMLGGRGARS